MIPIFVTVVVSPAKNGNAPQTPQPIKPKKNNFLYSLAIKWKFFFKVVYVKGNNIKKTTVHLQKASEMGGTNSTPPLATTKLLAIKIGWINNNDNGNILILKFFNFIKTNFYQRKLHRSSLW